MRERVALDLGLADLLANSLLNPPDHVPNLAAPTMEVFATRVR
jgi:hypothetical protein